MGDERTITREDVIKDLKQLAMTMMLNDSADRLGQSCAVGAAMLEQKEPVLADNIRMLAGIRCGQCPVCGTYMNTEVNPHYCGVCGQAIKWE